MKRYEQNGTIYYVYNDRSNLPTIVMIHGFRGTHHGMDLIAQALDDYRVIVPDLPGFGESKPLDNSHSIDNYSAWLNEFIKYLGLKQPPILLGHSFGSIIVSHFVANNPSSVTKLILINPIGSPALKGPKAIMTRLALVYYWLGRILPDPIATKLLSAKPIVMVMSVTMAKTKDRSLRKFIHSEHLKHFSSFNNRRVVSEAFKASVQNTVRDFADKIAVPTLIIAGSQDDITPIIKQHELAKLIQKTSLKVVDGVGHLTHYEKPESIASEVKGFTR